MALEIFPEGWNVRMQDHEGEILATHMNVNVYDCRVDLPPGDGCDERSIEALRVESTCHLGTLSVEKLVIGQNLFEVHGYPHNQDGWPLERSGAEKLQKWTLFRYS